MKRLLKEVKNYFTLDVALFVLLMSCVLIKSDLFLLHPFFIVLLSLSSNYHFKSYLSVNIISLLLSFLFSYEYGFLITIMLSTFFLLKMICNFFISKTIFKNYLPFILITFLFYSYLFFLTSSYYEIIKILILLTISIISFISFSAFLTKIKYQKKIPEYNRILSLSLFGLFFINISPFFLLIYHFILLMYLKSLTRSDALGIGLISSLYIYYLNDYSYLIIFSLLVPFLSALFVKKDKVSYMYLLAYIIYEALLIKNFFLDDAFYQGLIAILITIFIPYKLNKRIYNYLYLVKEDISTYKQTVSAIKDYIDYVVSPVLGKVESPKKNALNEFNNNLCISCNKKENCGLLKLKEKGIETKLSSMERKEVLEKCLTPYRFFKQSYIMKDVYQREFSKYETASSYQKAYMKELNNIYTPLKLLEKENINYLDKLKENLLEEEFILIDAYYFEDNLEIRLNQFNKDDINRIKQIIEEVYQKSITFVKSSYSFSSGSYLLLYTFKKQYKIDFAYSIKGINNTKKCGDYFKIINEDNKLIFLLSDGMGHSSYSASLSEYLIETILTYAKLNHDPLKQIETVNNLIYNKAGQESYATLDYFILDLVNLDFTLFKAGSFPNYIYHKYKVVESKKNFPPLGILKDVAPFAYKDKLEANDILVFMSDGFALDVMYIMEAILKAKAYLSAEEIKNSLLEILENDKKIQDDKTIVVFKIEKLP